MNRQLQQAIALALAGVASVATAQTSPTPEAATTELETVIVTGSFIRGTAEDAALPVDVITTEDLAKQGSPSTLELIKSLPNMGPVLGDTNQFAPLAQGSTGVGSANLRGLGGQRTLVLLNGRRMTDSAAGGVVDTNMLPLAAIGRVEVLKDGAAATYGSDAIGGVINFITRERFDGLEVKADYRYVDGSDGHYTASALFGWQGDNGNVLFGAGYQHRSELSTTERDWTQRPIWENPSGWSALGNPGSFFVSNPALVSPANPAGAFRGVTRDANCAEVGGFATWSGATQACYFNYIPFVNLVEETDQLQVYGEANANLSDTVKLHFEANYGKTELPDVRFSPSYPPTSGPTGPGSVNVYSISPHNPGFAAYAAQTGLVVPPAMLDTTSIRATLWRAFASGGNNSTGGLGGQSGARLYDTFRVSAGVNGDISDTLRWDTAVTFSQSTALQSTTDILIDRLQRALNGLGGASCNGIRAGLAGSTCQWFNPFSNAYPENPALGLANPGFNSANANAPDLVAWLFDKQQVEQRQSLFVFDAVANGELWSLPGGDIGWALGGQYRRGEFRSRINSNYQDARITPCPILGGQVVPPPATAPNCAFATGPYIFLGQATPVYLNDKVIAAFAEFNLPIFDALNVQLAGRYEDYGGLTGDTFNPKLSAKYQLFDSLALRASYGTTFRGPTAGNRAPTGATALAGIQAAGNNFKSVDTTGNPAIQPETATTMNLGLIFKAGGFQSTLDYWSYDLEDQITFVPPNTIATAVAGVGNGSQVVNCSHALRYLITFSNGNACTQGVTVGNDISRVKADTTNGPAIKTTGFDFSADYRSSMWAAGVNLTYVNSYEQADFVFNGIFVAAGYEAAGFTNYDRLPGTISKLRGNLYAEFSPGNHNVRVVVNYIGSAEDNRGPTVLQWASITPVPATGATQADRDRQCTVANMTRTDGTPSPTGACSLVNIGSTVASFLTADIHYRVELPRDIWLTASVNNVTDRAPPAARLEYTYDPFIGNPLGRTYELGLSAKF